MCKGELPLEIIRMKAKGIIPELGLRGNKGFTLPLNIGELGDDITKLDLSYCSLTGPLSIRTERYNFLFGWFLLTLIKFCRVRPRPERARDLDQPGEPISVQKRAASPRRRAGFRRWHGLQQPRGRCGFSGVLELNSR